MIYMHPDASNCETAGALRFPKLESLRALAKTIDYGTGAATWVCIADFFRPSKPIRRPKE
jgi:hypothetical protein